MWGGSDRALFLVNLAALMISSSGILGKLIILPSPVTSFYRCILAAVFILLIVRLVRKPFSWRLKRGRRSFILSGLFLALHWATYFYSLQLSNVSIAIISLFTYPIITTLIEPFFGRASVSGVNVVNSVLVIIGVFILVPESDFNNQYTYGILVGILSATFYALRNIFSKKLVQRRTSEEVMVIQLTVAAIVLSPSLFYYSYDLDLKTWGLLVVLGLITTAIGHTLFVSALKYLTASTASILASLQPVYAIILAVIIIGEAVGINVVLGGILILSAVLIQSLYPMVKKRRDYEVLDKQ